MKRKICNQIIQDKFHKYAGLFREDADLICVGKPSGKIEPMKLMQRIVQWDENSSKKFRMNFSGPVQFKVASLLSHSGDSWLWCGVLFLFWLFAEGSVQKNLAFWGMSIALTALFIFILKRVIHRKRPEGDWGSIYRKSDPHSFPSGHAARTAMLTVIAFGAGPLWLGILLFIWTLLVGRARVWMGVHYLSDILAGILVGIVAGVVVLQMSPWLANAFPGIF